MAYQVIARKYRPQRFADVVGQEHVTQTLANAIAQNRIAHAYLFCGPRGTGKTTIARIFAKCLNCAGGPRVDFDDADPHCVEITEGRSIDVLEIDGASNNGVEQVRDLRETVKYAPASSKFKIYIIDEVHMLTVAAFNALLKTLEEPPAHVKFLFATTDPEKVLPTILSRCQRFDLRRIPVPLLVRQLTDVAKKESVQIDAEALHAIARGADGGMRDAESALDQLISFCGNTITEADVLSMFGLTSRRQVVSLAGALLRGEPETVLRELNELSRHGKDLGRLLADLLGHMRNLLIHQVSKGDLSLLEVSEVEAASLAEQSALAGTDALTRVMEALAEAEAGLRLAASKKIYLEVTLLKAIEARNSVNLDAVLRQLQALRPADARADATPEAPPAASSQRSSATTAARAVEKTSKPPSPITAPAMTAPAPSGSLEDVWCAVLESVGRASPFTRTYLLEAHPVSLAKNVFTIGFDPEFASQLELVNNSKTHSLLQTKLRELGHADVQIKFIQAERPIGRAARQPVQQPPAEPAAAPAPAPAATPAPSLAVAKAAPATAKKEQSAPAPVNLDDFKKDPLIQKALEVFRGTIVEVRA